MRLRVFSAALAAIVLSFQSQAQTLTTNPAGEPQFDELMGPFLTNAFPTTPMQKGMKEVKIVPAKISATKSSERPISGGDVQGDYDVSGYGIGVSFMHAFSDHWGYSVIGAYEKTSGTVNPLLIEDGARGIDADVEQFSFLVMAGLIYDPFSDPEGFRMPIFFGLSLYDAKDERRFDGTVGGDSVTAEMDTSRTAVSFSFGLAPQFNVKSFRLSFLAAYMASVGEPEFTASFTNLTTGESGGGGSNSGSGDFNDGEENTNDIVALGLQIQYRPWNLGFLYVPSFFIERGSYNFVTLTWKKSWGGGDVAAADPAAEPKAGQ